MTQDVTTSSGPEDTGGQTAGVSEEELYPQFSEPDKNLTTKPLWFWNTDLDSMTTDQVREIVRESYLQSGYTGFGILPYWMDDYMSEKYFELYEAALDEGSKYGMQFSLYDENGFPSYTAGGLFAEKYPELTAKRLDLAEASIVSDGKIFLRIPQGTFMGAVAFNTETKEKVGKVFADTSVFPRFAVLNPRFTMTLPHYQMVAGIYDIFNHICEQYFSGTDDSTSDYLSEGLMRSVIHSSRIANRDPQNYEARSNIMWSATWALNTLVACGKSTDWMVHMLGQGLGGVTNATHGMTLAAVSLPYYRHILPYGLAKFRRFAVNVWNVNPEGKTDEEIAKEGLAAMEAWMRELGLVMNITELGATPDMLEKLADVTIILKGGYKTLTRDEVIEIFKESL